MTAFFSEVAVKSHVRAAADRQQRLVDIGHLENNVLADARTYRHHFASPFSQVGDVCTIGDFVLDAVLAEIVLHNGDALGMPGRIIVLISGLTPLLFFITGTYLWWQKRQLRRQAQRRKLARQQAR